MPKRRAIGWQEADQIADELRAALSLGRVPKTAQHTIADKHRVSISWLQRFAGARAVVYER